MNFFSRPSPTVRIGYQFSAEYVQLRPVIDEFPIKDLCIKEQMMINDEPDGAPIYHPVPIQYIVEGAASVNKLMKEMLNYRMATLRRARALYKSQLENSIDP
jgi:hypothetical protein